MRIILIVFNREQDGGCQRTRERDYGKVSDACCSLEEVLTRQGTGIHKQGKNVIGRILKRTSLKSTTRAGKQ